MKDKIILLMKETGCEQGEAELALEMCGYDVEKAVGAIPRLFQNIGALKGKIQIDAETLYGVFLVILNLKARTLLRARAVASYNPAVCAISVEQDWFVFEKHLYACRLRDGSVQVLSQELERILADFFVSREAFPFYSEAQREVRGKGAQALSGLLSRRFAPHPVNLVLHKDVLDMGQFQEIGGRTRSGGVFSSRADRKAGAGMGAKSGSPFLPMTAPGNGDLAMPGSLVLKVSIQESQGEREDVSRAAPGEGMHPVPRERPGSPSAPPAAIRAGELLAGDWVYVRIRDTRDVAQYLAKLLGASSEAASPLLVPVEAVEMGSRGRDVCIRVRFSLGVCGDVFLSPDVLVRVVRKTEPTSWWRKLFGT